eukprot:COSAG02_NODE_19_length_53976_cov_37.338512_26_plen_142_part_00
MPQDNEDVNLDIAHSLYAIAKQLDPSRPVNTADGIWCDTSLCLFDQFEILEFWDHLNMFVTDKVFVCFRGATATIANPQDFRSTGFALNTIPIGDPHQFSIAGVPPVPIIDHEMGTFETLVPRFGLYTCDSPQQSESSGWN